MAREDNVKDPVRSTPERDRWRCPPHAPIGLHRRPRGARTISVRAESDRAACPCWRATGYARNPKTSRAALPGAASAERPSSLELVVERRPAGSPVGSMRCYLRIALDRCPAQSGPHCNRQRIPLAAGGDELGGMCDETFEPSQFVIELRTWLRIAVREVDGSDQHSIYRRLNIARVAILRITRQT